MKSIMLIVAALAAAIGSVVGITADNGTDADAATSWRSRGTTMLTQHREDGPAWSRTEAWTADSAARARIAVRWTTPTDRGMRVAGDIYRYCERPSGTYVYRESTFNRWVKPGELVVLRNWDVERFERCEIGLGIHTELGPMRTGMLRTWIQQR